MIVAPRIRIISGKTTILVVLILETAVVVAIMIIERVMVVKTFLEKTSTITYRHHGEAIMMLNKHIIDRAAVAISVAGVNQIKVMVSIC